MKAFIILIVVVSATSLALIFYSSNWTAQTSAFVGMQNSVFFIDDNTGWVAGGSNISATIQKTTNGGANWENLYDSLNYTGPMNSIHFVNDSTGWAVGEGGKIIKTTNGGISWIPQISGTLLTLRSTYFVDNNRGWAVGTQGRIIRTTNGGANWVTQISGTSNSLFSLFFTDVATGFAVGGSGTIRKTTNGGINWSGQSIGSTPPLLSVYFINGTIGWIAGQDISGNGLILHTTNGGVNWTQQTSGVKFSLSSIHFEDKDLGWAVGIKDTILNTTNGGTIWNKHKPFSFLPLHSVYFPNPTAGWAVGETGTILKFTETDPGIRINLSVLFEGKYYQSSDNLNTKDTVTVYLRDAVTPFSLRDSSKGVIDTLNFSGNFTFSTAPSGLYYIVVKHFQCIETWSRAGGDSLFADDVLRSYNFTDSAYKAFGSNMKLKGSRYCMYSGDLDGNGFIDGTELLMTGNDASNFVTGRNVLTDINGDLIVDGSDYLIVDNNAFEYIEVRRP